MALFCRSLAPQTGSPLLNLRGLVRRPRSPAAAPEHEVSLQSARGAVPGFEDLSETLGDSSGSRERQSENYEAGSNLGHLDHFGEKRAFEKCVFWLGFEKTEQNCERQTQNCEAQCDFSGFSPHRPSPVKEFCFVEAQPIRTQNASAKIKFLQSQKKTNP